MSELTDLQAAIKAAFLGAKAEEDPSNFDAAMTDLSDAIGVAIDTFHGSGFSGFRGMLAGLELAQDTDADHDIVISVGSCRDDGDAFIMGLAAVLTKRSDAPWALGDDAGGMDTGTVAVDKTYHVHLIGRSDTGIIDALFSLSATAPTMPTNYDSSRRLGSVLTDGSANIIDFTQKGDEFLWKVPIQAFQDQAPGANLVTKTMKIPLGVKVWSVITVQFLDTSFAAGTVILFQSADQTDTTPTIGVNHLRIRATNNNPTMTKLAIRSNLFSQIFYKIDPDSADIFITVTSHGWIDRRGKDD